MPPLYASNQAPAHAGHGLAAIETIASRQRLRPEARDLQACAGGLPASSQRLVGVVRRLRAATPADAGRPTAGAAAIRQNAPPCQVGSIAASSWPAPSGGRPGAGWRQNPDGRNSPRPAARSAAWLHPPPSPETPVATGDDRPSPDASPNHRAPRRRRRRPRAGKEIGCGSWLLVRRGGEDAPMVHRAHDMGVSDVFASWVLLGAKATSPLPTSRACSRPVAGRITARETWPSERCRPPPWRRPGARPRGHPRTGPGSGCCGC